MLRLILSYGGIAGLVIIVINTASLEFGRGQAWLGFLVMFIAFSTIYVAIRQYRDLTQGGVISFSRALLVGLGISAVASLVYVAVWEAYLAWTDYAFIERYANAMTESRVNNGATEAELAQAMQDAEQFKAQYLNPLFRMPITVLEIFPVGLLVSLVSAATLRNHGDHRPIKNRS